MVKRIDRICVLVRALALVLILGACSHLAIAQAAHNQILYNAVQMIRSLMFQWMLVTLHVPGVGAKVLSQHGAIFEGIRARDANAARDAMRAHVTELGDLLIRIRSAAVIAGSGSPAVKEFSPGEAKR